VVSILLLLLWHGILKHAIGSAFLRTVCSLSTGKSMSSTRLRASMSGKWLVDSSPCSVLSEWQAFSLHNLPVDTSLGHDRSLSLFPLPFSLPEIYPITRSWGICPVLWLRSHQFIFSLACCPSGAYKHPKWCSPARKFNTHLSNQTSNIESAYSDFFVVSIFAFTVYFFPLDFLFFFSPSIVLFGRT